jgi:hypothetical protein
MEPWDPRHKTVNCSLGIAIKVLNEDLVNQAAFAGPAIIVAHVARRAEDPKPDFARRITAEYRPVVDQYDLDTGPCRSNGTANAGQAAAYDDQVTSERFDTKLAFLRRWWLKHADAHADSWLKAILADDVVANDG